MALTGVDVAVLLFGVAPNGVFADPDGLARKWVSFGAFTASMGFVVDVCLQLRYTGPGVSVADLQVRVPPLSTSFSMAYRLTRPIVP